MHAIDDVQLVGSGDHDIKRQQDDLSWLYLLEVPVADDTVCDWFASAEVG